MDSLLKYKFTDNEIIWTLWNVQHCVKIERLAEILQSTDKIILKTILLYFLIMQTDVVTEYPNDFVVIMKFEEDIRYVCWYNNSTVYSLQ